MRWDSRCVLRSSTKPLGGALLFSCITDYDTEDDSGISMAFVVSFSAVFDCSSVGFCFVFVLFLFGFCIVHRSRQAALSQGERSLLAWALGWHWSSKA
jgi:hypothetical protein